MYNLTSSCGTIGEDRAIEAIEDGLHQVLCCSLKNLLICGVGPVDCVKGKLLVLLLLLVEVALVVLLPLVVEILLILLRVKNQHLVINDSHLKTNI